MTDAHRTSNSQSHEGNVARYSRTVGSFLSRFIEHAAVGPIDDLGMVFALQAAADRSAQRPIFHDVTITRILQETDDCRSFEFDTQKLPAFKPTAGQFIPVRVNIRGDIHERCYAVSSLVARGDAPRFTVKRVPSGLVSNWCHDELKRGMTISIGGPAGQFRLRTGTEAPLVFMAAGIGIAPILPMFREALLLGDRLIKLMIFDRNETSAPFLQSYRELALWYGEKIELAEIYTGPTGTVHASVIEDHLRNLIEADVYMCGPAGFTQLAETAAIAAGLSQNRIFINERAEIAADRP